MSSRRIAFILILLAFGVSPARAQSAPNTSQQALFDLLNAERARSGVRKLQWDPHLAESALSHARRMADQGQLSHQFAGEPDLDHRIRATGLRFDAWGENVALAGSVEDIHDALMNSPPHRANILDPKYNAVGIAILPRGNRLYAVQNFASIYPSFTETQFRDGLIAAFNQARKARKTFPVEVRTDSRLAQAACSGNSDVNTLLRNQRGAVTIVLFTSSSPDKVPPDMLEAAGDSNLARMNLGVCFRPGKEQGNASFRVVAVFYPALRSP
jgi:uncharacterized protein YkwD